MHTKNPSATNCKTTTTLTYSPAHHNSQQSFCLHNKSSLLVLKNYPFYHQHHVFVSIQFLTRKCSINNKPVRNHSLSFSYHFLIVLYMTRPTLSSYFRSALIHTSFDPHIVHSTQLGQKPWEIYHGLEEYIWHIISQIYVYEVLIIFRTRHVVTARRRESFDGPAGTCIDYFRLGLCIHSAVTPLVMLRSLNTCVCLCVCFSS